MRKHLFCLILASPLFLAAQGIDLEQAIAIAKENNRSIVNAAVDIQIARQKRWETIAIGLPQISLSAGYANALQQPTSLIPAEFFGGQAGEFSEVVFGTEQSANAGLRLEQLLFDGSYLVGLQASEIYLRISKQAFVKTEQAIAQATVDAYVNALLSKAQLNVFEQNLSTAQDNLNDVQAIYENGLAEKESVQQLELTVLSLKSGLLYTKQMAEVAENVLRYVMGIDLDAPLNLSSTLEGLALQSQEKLPNTLDVNANINFQMAENNIRVKELLLKLERFKSMPKISAYLSGGYDGYNQSFNFTEPEQNWYGRANFGVTINVPIFSSLQSQAKRQQAKLALKQSENQAIDVAQKLLLEENKLRNEVQFNLSNVQTLAQNLALATEIERKNQLKFKEGLASSFELRQAQTQLYQAQNNYLSSMQQLVVTKKKLSLLLNPIKTEIK